jgi:hypothetical protein
MRNPNLFAYLSTVPAVTAIAAQRIHPDKIPQHDLDGPVRVPAVVYARSSVEEQMTFCGPDDLVRITMSVDSYALAYDDAEALADAVRKALVGFSGQMGPVLVNALQPDTESVPGPDPEPGLFRVYQSFNIWCREAPVS